MAYSMTGRARGRGVLGAVQHQAPRPVGRGQVRGAVPGEPRHPGRGRAGSAVPGEPLPGRALQGIGRGRGIRGRDTRQTTAPYVAHCDSPYVTVPVNSPPETYYFAQATHAQTHPSDSGLFGLGTTATPETRAREVTCVSAVRADVIHPPSPASVMTSETSAVSRVPMSTRTEMGPETDSEPEDAGRSSFEMPTRLADAFMDGTKHPVSCMMELASITRLPLSFKEADAATEHTYTAIFASECEFGGRTFPQGRGRTKKEAKTEAARTAFTILLQGDHTGLMVPPAEELSPEKPCSAFDLHEIGDKHPIMMLGEYCAKTRRTVEITVSDSSGDTGFVSKVVIDGEEVAWAGAQSKKEAKKLAADKALKMMYVQEECDQEPQHTDSHYDKVSKLVGRAFRTLMEAPFSENWKSLAAFIITRDSKEELGEVVAMATGESLIPDDYVEDSGQRLVDCHAPTVARRALLRYLYCEVRKVTEGLSATSIFEVQRDSALLRLRADVSIHLYCNSAPNGDALTYTNPSVGMILTNEEADVINSGMHQPTFTQENHGHLRVKLEQGSVTMRTLTLHGEQSWADVQGGQKLRVMSNSDKLLKWNVCGLQGALLSHFMEPIYLSSIVLGSMYEHGHMTRAACCRVSEDLSRRLPPGYSLQHPHVGRVTLYLPLPAVLTSLSTNWSKADPGVEVVDARSGQTVVNSPCRAEDGNSRLCKLALSRMFSEIVQKVESFRPLLGLESYGAIKRAATGYQKVNTLMKRHLEEAGYGPWFSKPQEIDNFRL